MTPDTPRRTADDVAADMTRRLHELEQRLAAVERQLERPIEQPLQHIGGDQTARVHGESRTGEPGT